MYNIVNFKNSSGPAETLSTDQAVTVCVNSKEQFKIQRGRKQRNKSWDKSWNLSLQGQGQTGKESTNQSSKKEENETRTGSKVKG